MPQKHIQDFPSPSEVEEHIEMKSSQERPKIPWTRPVLGLLAVLIIGLLISIAAHSGAVSQLSPKGSVAGIVVLNSTPVPADVFLLKSDLKTSTGADGSFLLQNVPAGPQQVIVAYSGIGFAFPVTIETGKTVNLGQVEVQKTRAPAK